MQVGTIGLLKSIDRFDTDRGVEFSTYATPTIIGEIKRYFRDKGWAIRVPRRLQELRMQIGSATAELTQSLGRSPTPRELAEAIGCSVEEIIEGLESSNAYSTLSLDASDDTDEGGSPMLDAIGDRRRQPGARRDPRVHQAAARPARPPREADPPAALLQEHDPVADRRRDRRLPDARLPPARPAPWTTCAASLQDESPRPSRSGLVLRSPTSARVLAGWSTPATTTRATTPRASATTRGLPAAEAPRHSELDQLGEHHRPARPGAHPPQPPRAERAARRRTPGRRPPWWRPSSPAPTRSRAPRARRTRPGAAPRPRPATRPPPAGREAAWGGVDMARG